MSDIMDIAIASKHFVALPPATCPGASWSESNHEGCRRCCRIDIEVRRIEEWVRSNGSDVDGISATCFEACNLTSCSTVHYCCCNDRLTLDIESVSTPHTSPAQIVSGLAGIERPQRYSDVDQGLRDTGHSITTVAATGHPSIEYRSPTRS